MTLFIALAALLAAVAVLLLVWPLLRPASQAGESSPARSGTAATVVAALLPLLAFAGYFWASNWDWQADTTPRSAPNIEHVVAALRERLRQNPDDIDGWKMLGRSATVMGDLTLAREAFGEAYTRSRGRDADAVVGYAESLVMNDEREIDGQAAVLFERALEMDPDHARALWYGGIVAYRRGDLALAQQRWVELQNHQLPLDLRQIVAERLAEIEAANGGGAAAAVAAPPDPSAISLSIDVGPAVAASVPASAALYVIARRGDAGPPIAVVRRTVSDWPLAVSIGDTDAMLPGVKLAGGGPIRLIARISLSGSPTATSGDLFGEVSYDFTATGPIQVRIDRVVP